MEKENESITRAEFESFKESLDPMANAVMLHIGGLHALETAVFALIGIHPNPQEAWDRLRAALGPGTNPYTGDLREEGWNAAAARLGSAAVTALSAHQSKAERKN